MEDIVSALQELKTEGSFCASQTLPGNALQLGVRDLGDLKFPLTPDTVKTLVEGCAHRAKYGQTDKTLLDTRVRDTWQIPADRLQLGDGWERALQPALEALAVNLGLRSHDRRGARLRPPLHDLLVYGPGQFFLPHQDSEKLPGMVATLIVVLPSSHEGGALRVEHRSHLRLFQGSAPEESHGLTIRVAWTRPCTPRKPSPGRSLQ